MWRRSAPALEAAPSARAGSGRAAAVLAAGVAGAAVAWSIWRAEPPRPVAPAASPPRAQPEAAPPPALDVPHRPAPPRVPAAAHAEASALMASASEARARGDLRTAVEQLQAAVERAPSVETHAALGALYLEMGVTAAADTHLRSAAEGDPRNADRWIALANACSMKPDPGAAAEALDRARAVEPGIRITRNATGWLVREPPAPQP